MKKRGISFLLALAMVISLFPVPAVFAAEEPEEEVIIQQEEPVVEPVEEIPEVIPEETPVATPEEETPEEPEEVIPVIPEAPSDEEEPDEDPIEPDESEILEEDEEEETELDEDSLEKKDAEAATSGTIGTLKWAFYEEDGLLTITGSGAIPDSYGFNELGYETSTAPWKDLNVTRLELDNRITSIGKGAFMDLPLQRINTLGEYSEDTMTFPSSLKTIGDHAFQSIGKWGWDDPVQKNIIFPASLTKIGESAFSNFFGEYIKYTFDLPASLESIGNYGILGNVSGGKILLRSSKATLGAGCLPSTYNEKIAVYAYANSKFPTYNEIQESIGNNYYDFYEVTSANEFDNPPTSYTLTFNANGGSFSTANTSFTVNAGEVFQGTAPVPSKAGQYFIGWTRNGQDFLLRSTPICGNYTLTAVWSATPPATPAYITPDVILTAGPDNFGDPYDDNGYIRIGVFYDARIDETLNNQGYELAYYEIYRAKSASDSFECIGQFSLEDDLRNDHSYTILDRCCYLFEDPASANQVTRGNWRYYIVGCYTHDGEIEKTIASAAVDMGGMYRWDPDCNNEWGDKSNGDEAIAKRVYVSDREGNEITALTLHCGESSPVLYTAVEFENNSKAEYPFLLIGETYIFHGQTFTLPNGTTVSNTFETQFGYSQSCNFYSNDEKNYLGISGTHTTTRLKAKSIPEDGVVYISLGASNYGSVILPVTILEAEEGVDYDAADRAIIEAAKADGRYIENEEDILPAIRQFATTFDFENSCELVFDPEMYEAAFGDGDSPSEQLFLENYMPLYDIYGEREGMTEKEGDYLYYTSDLGQIRTRMINRYVGDTKYPAMVVYFADHFNGHTKEMEDQVDAKVDELFGPGGALESANTGSTYSKLEKIYNYVSQNTTWKNALTDELYYTAWSALIRKQASCQGMALAFYRLARHVGIPVKCIGVTSDSLSGGITAHSFCIAQMPDGKWYVVDPTNKTKSAAFLKGASYNPNTLYPIYLNEYTGELNAEFAESYPVSKSNYVPAPPSTILDIAALNDQTALDAIQNGSGLNIKEVAATSFAKSGSTYKAAGTVATIFGKVQTSVMDTMPAEDSIGYYLAFRVNVDKTKVKDGAELWLNCNGSSKKVADYEQLKQGYADVLVDATEPKAQITLTIDLDADSEGSAFSPASYTVDVSAVQRGPKLSSFTFENKTTTSALNFDPSAENGGDYVRIKYIIGTATPASFYDYAMLDDAIVWKSSNEAVARIYGDYSIDAETGTGYKDITPEGPGKAVITGELNGKKITLNVTVYSVTAGHAIVAEWDDAEKGSMLQTDETVGMVLKDKVTGEMLDNSLFYFTTSSITQATVDEAGTVTAHYTNADGSVKVTPTITATLKGDPAARKAALKVTAVPHQIEAIDLYRIDGESTELTNEIIIDKAAVASGAVTYSVKACEVDAGDSPIPTKLTWVSSDTGIATAAYNATTKLSTITVKKGVYGEVTLTATVGDVKKTTASIVVKIVDKAPRISTKSVTLNPRKTAGVTLDILPSYDNEVLNVTLANGTRATDIADGFTIEKVEYTVGTYEINVTDHNMAKVTRNLFVEVTTTENSAEPYRFPLTVSVVPSLPAVDTKQPVKFNLFYNDTDEIVTVSVKNETVNNVELKDAENSQFALSWPFDSTDNSIHIGWNQSATAVKDPAEKLNTKLVLLVSVDGYAVPVEKAITLATVTTKPNYALRTTATTYNNVLNDLSNATVALTVYDKNIKTTAATLADANVPLSSQAFEVSISKENFPGNFAAALEDNRMVLHMNLPNGLFAAAAGKTSTNSTATINLQHRTWRMPLTFTHKVTLTNAKPGYALSKSTLVLNSLYAGTGANSSAKLTMNGSYGLVENAVPTFVDCADGAVVSLIPSYKEGTPDYVNASKVKFSFVDGELTASLPAGEEPVAKTYSYKLTPEACANGQTIALAAKDIKVQIVNVKPTLTVSSKAMVLNADYDNLIEKHAYPDVIKLSTKNLPDIVDAKLDDFEATPKYTVGSTSYKNADMLDVRYDSVSGNVLVTVKDGAVLVAGTYNYTMTPKLNVNGVALAPITVKVNVTKAKPTVAYSASTVTMNSAFTALHNPVSGASRITLTLNKANLADQSLMIDHVDIKPNYKESDPRYNQLKDIPFLYHQESGTYTLSWSNKLPKTGSYSFIITPYLSTSSMPLASKTITVKIVDTKPEANTIPTIIVSNDSPVGIVGVSLKKSNDALLKTLTNGDPDMTRILNTEYQVLETAETLPAKKAEAEKLFVTYSSEDVMKSTAITVRIPEGETVQAGSYKFRFTPKFFGGTEDTVGKAVTFTVTVTNSKPTITVKATGSIDAVQRSAGITHQITKLNNTSDGLYIPFYYDGTYNLNTMRDVIRVLDASGNESEIFEISDVIQNEKGLFVVTTLKNSAEIVTGTQSYMLEFTTYSSRKPIRTPILKTTIKQSALKLTLDNTTPVTFYQSNVSSQMSNYVTRKVTLTTPADAGIEKVTINKAKTTPALLNVFANDGTDFTPADYGSNFRIKSCNILIAPSTTIGLKAGTTYNLVLDVTPIGCATNVKPTEITVKITIQK